MASTFTDNASLEKQATGENDNTWGTKWNAVLDTIDALLCQRTTIALTDADTTLVTSQVLYAVILFSGTLTAARTVTFPAEEQWHVLQNSCDYALTIAASGGTQTVVIPPYRDAMIYIDGSGDVYPMLAAGPAIADYEPVNTNATTGATETLDTSLYSVFDMTMNASCAFTLTKPAHSGYSTSIVLYLRQDGTGGWTASFTNTIRWPGGVAPTLSTAASAYDVLVLTTHDGGTTWNGYVVGIGFA